MNNTDLARYGKRFVQYFWDPWPKNENPAVIWCLGKEYESHPLETDDSGSQATPRSDQNKQPTTTSTEESGNSTVKPNEEDVKQIDKSEASEQEEGLANGWPADFLDDVEARIWITYRSGFTSIPKTVDGRVASGLSFAMRLKQLANSQEGFSTDSGFGCMIRSGQSLLANTLSILRLGRDWRVGQSADQERELLSLFADDPAAPFSIHRFVEHGAAACGKHPGEWFGPSAAARCIHALSNAHASTDLQVYVRADDADVYEDSFLKTARDTNGTFRPTLILLGTRLGIDRVTPVYWQSLKQALQMPQSVGIAGGRPNRSHYFIGTQGSKFFYLDPHYTRPALPLKPSAADVATCHTRRLRSIDVTEMDPSMLIGFLIRSEEEWRQWRAAVSAPPTSDDGDGEGDERRKAKSVVHVHDAEPQYTSGAGAGAGGRAHGEREGAVEEVQSCDDSDDDETIV